MASFPFLGYPALIRVKCLRFQSLYILSLIEACQVDKDDSLYANNELLFLRSTLESLRSMLLNCPSRDTVNMYMTQYILSIP